MKYLTTLGVMFTLIVAAHPANAQTKNRQIVNQQFRVAPGGWTLFDVLVTPDMVEPALVGEFVAAGGSGSDVEVIVGLRNEFLNWFNGHGGRIVFASGRRTADQLKIPIPEPGHYVLAFHNKFSVVTIKTVNAAFALTFQTVPPKKSEVSTNVIPVPEPIIELDELDLPPNSYFASVTVGPRPEMEVKKLAWEIDPGTPLRTPDLYVHYLFNRPKEILWSPVWRVTGPGSQ